MVQYRVTARCIRPNTSDGSSCQIQLDWIIGIEWRARLRDEDACLACTRRNGGSALGQQASEVSCEPHGIGDLNARIPDWLSRSVTSLAAVSMGKPRFSARVASFGIGG